ncbi:MAG: RNA polymerase factor sigma-54 [Kiritimatiellia bacterium]|nr:RNA polymerase factor sigma-54 [Lentisphaerota bacterium]
MAQQSISMLQDQRQVQTLAPQLRQSLEMLQLPLMELRTMVQNELQLNPTLEEKPPETAPLELDPSDGGVDDAKELNFNEEFEILSRMDDEWFDYFMQEQEYRVSDTDRDRKREFVFNTDGESLQEHLRGQLAVAALDEYEKRLGELLIGSINEDGHLAQDLEPLAESAAVDVERLRDILHLVQDFDPVGVGARNLSECLMLQLERLGHDDASVAMDIVREHLELLGRHDYQEIARRLACPITEVHRAARLIATLDPKPGRAFSPTTTQYVAPDVVVEKIDGVYQVMLNDDQLPHLRISRQYRDLMRQEDTKTEVREYIRERMRSGMLLIKSIVQRQQTLYRVASEIVRVQTDFLDQGIAHLKPLVMADVARRVKLHETTISRCVANKYMQTPQGLLEMKFFFTPGLKTANGAAVSNKTVQDMIASQVAREDPEHPLSDQELEEKLRQQGIKVARRTIAKYRLTLKIPPSHLRRAHL